MPSSTSRSLSRSIRHTNDERRLDCYQTPPEATQALLRAERLPKVLWENSCGPGAIVRVLRAAGHEVLATDLQDYRSPDQDLAGFDFLLQDQLPFPGIEAIVMNPPYNRTNDFVRKALELCPRVYALLRIQYLEGQRRTDILDQLERVHVFSNRLPMMHRDGWDGPRATNTAAFAWYAFNRFHLGPTSLYRIRWEPLLSVKM